MTGSIAAVLATALAGALVLVQPWVGRRRYRRLVAAVEEHPEARLRHYRRGIVGEWAVVGVILVIGLLAGRGPSSIGLDGGHHVSGAIVVVAEAAAVLGASALVFRSRSEAIVKAIERQARGFLALLPQGREQRLVFAGLAVTAGICEEVIFRGFGIAYLRWVWPGVHQWEVMVIVAVAFGLVHLYQGPRGVILTGLIGAYLAWLVLWTGSLVPAIVIHALLDLRILALPDRRPAPTPAGAPPA